MPASVFSKLLLEMYELQDMYHDEGGWADNPIWKAIAAEHDLTVGKDSLAKSLAIERASPEPPQSHTQAQEEINTIGYTILPPLNKNLAAAVSRAIAAVAEHNLPPVFALVFDEAWQLLDEQLEALEASNILGTEGVVLEADINCWKLTETTPGSVKRVGGNFSNPHRDLRYDQCHEVATDKLTALSLWVPVNKAGATACNGAMRCLPINQDPLFFCPDHPDHMTTSPTLASQAAVLVAEQGSACCWQPSLIHYGGSYSPSSSIPPRMSIAATFRAAEAPRCKFEGNGVRSGIGERGEGGDGPGAIGRKDLSCLTVGQRLAYASKAVLSYSHWYPGMEGCDLVSLKNNNVDDMGGGGAGVTPPSPPEATVKSVLAELGLAQVEESLIELGIEGSVETFCKAGQTMAEMMLLEVVEAEDARRIWEAACKRLK